MHHCSEASFGLKTPDAAPPIMGPAYQTELDEWASAPDRVRLSDGGVHLWRVELNVPEDDLGRLHASLSQEEVTRAERFVRPIHGRRFVVAHGVLRLVLAKYLVVDPKSIEFQKNEHGKPDLVHKSAITFNLSHSGDLALIGVTEGRAIGVDLERFRERLEMEKISRRYFSPGEVATLFRFPERARERAFYTCWTRKEAYIKARGEGLSLGLDRFDVAFASDEAPGLLRSDKGEEELKRWSFLDLKVRPRYAAACVVEGRIRELRCWEAADRHTAG